MQTISTPSNHVSSAKVYVCSFCSACFPSLTQECSHSDEPGIEIGSGSLFWPPNKHYNFASFRKYQRETRTRKQTWLPTHTYRLVYITWNFKQKHTHTHTFSSTGSFSNFLVLFLPCPSPRWPGLPAVSAVSPAAVGLGAKAGAVARHRGRWGGADVGER